MERQALADTRRDATPSLNTTIGVVLTDAVLTKAQARKVAAVSHDGLARAVAPVHSMLDGDTIFCLASGRRALGGDDAAAGPSTGSGNVGNRGNVRAFDALLEAAADVFTAACLDAVLRADSRGPWRSYVELAPSVLGARDPGGGAARPS